jgi:hypothetical protein
MIIEVVLITILTAPLLYTIGNAIADQRRDENE